MTRRYSKTSNAEYVSNTDIVAKHQYCSDESKGEVKQKQGRTGSTLGRSRRDYKTDSSNPTAAQGYRQSTPAAGLSWAEPRGHSWPTTTRWRWRPAPPSVALVDARPQLPRLRDHQQQIRSTSGPEPSPVYISSRPFVGWAAGSTASLAAAGAVAARCIITSRHRTEDAATTGPAARARERCGANSSRQPQPVCHGVDQIAGPTADLATAGAVAVALSTSCPGPPQHR